MHKDIKIYTQNGEDAEEVRNVGFTNVQIFEKTNYLGEITLIKTPAQHGRGEVLKIAGNVCGLIFKNENEKTLYVAGDTVWYEKLKKN